LWKFWKNMIITRIKWDSFRNCLEMISTEELSFVRKWWDDGNHQLFNWICFSDETTFELNESVNRQNLRYWADNNPHWMRDCHTQYPHKLNVWAGIIDHCIVDPFFIEGNINAYNYVHLLRTVVPCIQNITGNAFENVCSRMRPQLILS